jgi:hypothetical protein
MPVTLAVITSTFPAEERSKAIDVWTAVARAHLRRKLVVRDHALNKPFLTMLFAAATIASWGSRGVQSSTRRAFSLEVFLA